MVVHYLGPIPVAADPANADPSVTPTPDPNFVPPAPYIWAQLDTAATRTLTLPLGNGQYRQVTGGEISVALTDESPECGNFWFTLVATDLATGKKAESAPYGMVVACS